MKILKGTHPGMLMSAWYSESEMEAAKEALSRGRDLSNMGDADFGQRLSANEWSKPDPNNNAMKTGWFHSH